MPETDDLGMLTHKLENVESTISTLREVIQSNTSHRDDATVYEVTRRYYDGRVKAFKQVLEWLEEDLA